MVGAAHRYDPFDDGCGGLSPWVQVIEPGLARSWVYGYDGLDRLISADNQNGTGDDAAYAYDAADNMMWNSRLCAANPNMVYPAQGSTAIHPHAPG